MPWISRKEASCLQVGDIVETDVRIPGTKVTFPIFKHYGIIVYVCKIPYICHLPGRVKPIFESLESFENERVIGRVLRDKNTEALNNDKLVDNYHRLVDKEYRFWGHNCESFVREMTDNKVNIGLDQRCGYGILVLIILLIIYLATRK